MYQRVTLYLCYQPVCLLFASSPSHTMLYSHPRRSRNCPFTSYTQYHEFHRSIFACALTRSARLRDGGGRKLGHGSSGRRSGRDGGKKCSHGEDIEGANLIGFSVRRPGRERYKCEGPGWADGRMWLARGDTTKRTCWHLGRCLHHGQTDPRVAREARWARLGQRKPRDHAFVGVPMSLPR